MRQKELSCTQKMSIINRIKYLAFEDILRIKNPDIGNLQMKACEKCNGFFLKC